MRIAKVICGFVFSCAVLGYASSSKTITFALGAEMCGGGRFGCKFGHGYNSSSRCFNSMMHWQIV